MIKEIKRLIVKEKEIIEKIKTSKPEKITKYVKILKELNDKIPEMLQDVKIESIESETPEPVQDKTKEKKQIIKRPPVSGSTYIRIANKLFIRTSDKLTPLFSELGQDIRKANMSMILISYISTMIFSVLLSFGLGILIYGVLILINLSNWIYFWIVLLIPAITFLLFYTYPSGEANSNDKAIMYELPFATIHMSAIATSDIEPTKIFKIIAATEDYKHVGREMRKIISQVEIYGYDLVTSLKNVASQISNKKMAELLGGLAINISTGGELKTYLQKKAENYLVDYRLERKKYIDIAGTFMDIYIAILIATPLILVLMFVLMNVSGLGFEGISLQVLMFFAIAIVIVLNIIFLLVLNIKQPKV